MTSSGDGTGAYGGRIAILVLQKYRQGIDVEAELRAYMDLMLPLIGSVGGRIAWAGRPMGVVIGSSHDAWDAVVVVEYPTAEAAARLLRDERFVAATEHRRAAFERLEVHVCQPVIDAVRGT